MFLSNHKHSIQTSLNEYTGVQHILCCVVVLFVFVLCTLCWQFLWIVHFWLPLRYSLKFIHKHVIVLNILFSILTVVHLTLASLVRDEHASSVRDEHVDSREYSQIQQVVILGNIHVLYRMKKKKSISLKILQLSNMP